MSPAGFLRAAAAGLLALVLACGRPDDERGSSLPVGARDEDESAASGPDESHGDAHTEDAGARPPSSDSSDCPAPRPEAAPGVASGWARDPATGDCCPYANRDAAPNGWLPFDSDIECRCSLESCPSSLEEAEQSLCAVPSPAADVFRFVGCGVVAVADNARYVWTFEQPGDPATPATRLVGAAKLSDAGSTDAGATSSWKAGVDIAQCDYGPASECQLCGGDPDADFQFPPCQ